MFRLDRAPKHSVVQKANIAPRGRVGAIDAQSGAEFLGGERGDAKRLCAQRAAVLVDGRRRIDSGASGSASSPSCGASARGTSGSSGRGSTIGC